MGLTGNLSKFDESLIALTEMLCPGSVTLHTSRIDTKAVHPHPAIYQADVTYFRVMHDRAFIREAHCGEFDYSPSKTFSCETYPNLEFQSVAKPNEILRSVWKHVPPLWVMVTDHGEGMHHVTAMFRGKAMWKVADKDGRQVAVFKSTESFAEALASIQACEGMDNVAWEQFAKRYWDASVLAASVGRKGEVIH